MRHGHVRFVPKADIERLVDDRAGAYGLTPSLKAADSCLDTKAGVRPMQTALCKRLGIELPIIQAPMGGAVQANETDTVYLENFFNIRWPNASHRTLRNKTIEIWEAAGRPPAGKRPGEGEMIGISRSIGPIVSYQSYTPGADADGDIDATALWAGQSVGLVSTVQPAGEIVRQIADEADAILLCLALTALGQERTP